MNILTKVSVIHEPIISVMHPLMLSHEKYIESFTIDETLQGSNIR